MKAARRGKSARERWTLSTPAPPPFPLLIFSIRSLSWCVFLSSRRSRCVLVSFALERELTLCSGVACRLCWPLASSPEGASVSPRPLPFPRLSPLHAGLVGIYLRACSSGGLQSGSTAFLALARAASSSLLAQPGFETDPGSMPCSHHLSADARGPPLAYRVPPHVLPQAHSGRLAAHHD